MAALLNCSAFCLGAPIMDDSALLQQYVQGASQSAFAQIIERYSPLVFSICLRVLKDRQAAEDAAQATFVVLMRRGGALPEETILPAWLHRTALNCARNLRRSLERRRQHETCAPAALCLATARADLDSAREDIKDQLDEALRQLPQAQQSAIILRYLQGLSAEEAARQMRCPEKTFYTRLSRGLERLREVLQRRGVAVSSVALSAFLLNHSAEAAPAQLASTLVAISAGKTAPSTVALVLAKTTLAGAFWLKLLLCLAAVLLLGVASLIGLSLHHSVPAAVPAAAAGLPAGPQDFDLFDEQLAGGWLDQSWHASIKILSSPQAYSGRRFIEYIPQAAWAGLDFAHTHFTTQDYIGIQFAAKASEPGQRFSVFLKDSANQNLTQPLALAAYGGELSTTQWKRYTIPLADLNGVNRLLGSLVIHEWTGRPQGPLYVDAVKFVRSLPDTSPDF